jgi:hypothetical protein
MEAVSSIELPPQFAELAPFAAKWALASENQRSAVRWAASPADYEALYRAMSPRLGEILALLSAHPPGGVPDALAALYRLACAFAEAAPHHELYKGSAEVPHSFDPRRFRALHGDEPS